MWMVDPRQMCRQHLLGEHNELHMFAGTMRKGIGLAGYVTNNCIEPSAIICRHTEIVNEMERRGYKHKTELKTVSLNTYETHIREATVDKDKSAELLVGRCTECAKLQRR
jgi:hypothetical protein